MKRVGLVFTVLVLVSSPLLTPASAAASDESDGSVGPEGIEVSTLPTDESAAPADSQGAIEDTETEQDEPGEQEADTSIQDGDVAGASDSAGDELPLPALANGVIITELQTRSALSANGEKIELYNASETDIDITGWCIQKASATGNYDEDFACIVADDDNFATRIILPADAYVLLVSTATITNEPELQFDLTFTGGLADGGGKLRVVNASGEVIDMLGWGEPLEFSGSGPAPKIPSSSPVQSLQRVRHDAGYQSTPDNYLDFKLGAAKTEFVVGALYELIDLCTNLNDIQDTVPDTMIRSSSGECVDESTVNFCPGLRISEVAANTTKQYIELRNVTDQPLQTKQCIVMTNRSATMYTAMPEGILEPGAYHTIYIEDTDLRLTKSTTGTVYVLASDHETEIDEVEYSDLSADTSWSLIDDGWHQSYTLTPGTDNVFAKYAPCPVGQIRNEETGRCRNDQVLVSTLTPCRADQYRSPETGRCRNVASTATLTPCREGQVRNQETNRCRAIATTASSPAPCKQGQERNPETNRCRTIKTSTPANVGFAIEPVEETAEAMLGWWAFGGAGVLAAGYATWEWRKEFAGHIKKITHFFAAKN